MAPQCAPMGRRVVRAAWQRHGLQCRRLFGAATVAGESLTSRKLGNRTAGCIGMDIPGVLHTERDASAAVNIVRKAFDHGVTLFDVCDDNGSLLPAELFRKATDAGGTPSGLIVSAHIGVANDAVDHSPDALRHQLDTLLKTLGTQSIPLLSLAGVDPNQPWEASLGLMKEFREQGLCDMVGVSDVHDTAHITTALDKAGIVAVRHRMSVVNRHVQSSGILDLCDQKSLAVLAYRPFGPPDNIAKLAHHPTLRQLADKHDTTPLQICLSWLLLTPCIIPLSPLPSVRLDGADVDLDLADLELFQKMQTEA
ncbi:NADP-dependent oxidoreductase domain-containing protein [Plasmodiophora brassicae]|uniref:NADP-dependent oxidoreductase domain-containing protein n=1 Tax=Plasmodiophora brassicae TaxID=37360 RepID=A0A0G4IYB5_PLABS|nr:hypothetical protein PBRA_007961 [Plasmodiophora brassicae]SPQ96493.1 unnamed protein product [Plasmodiophora brassicae]